MCSGKEGVGESPVCGEGTGWEVIQGGGRTGVATERTKMQGSQGTVKSCPESQEGEGVGTEGGRVIQPGVGRCGEGGIECARVVGCVNHTGKGGRKWEPHHQQRWGW